MSRTKLKNYVDGKQQDLGHDPEELSKLTKIERAVAGMHLLMNVSDITLLKSLSNM